MTLELADRLAIHELISLHGHLMDAGAFDRLADLFTEDVGYDTSAFGGEVMHGIAAIVAAGRNLGANNPVGHHVTNILVGEDLDGTVRARSKGIGVYADGSCGSVIYDDILRRQPDGWRIAWRTVSPRRAPLRP
jgi:hypothetical protein